MVISEVTRAKAAACISDAAGQDTVTLPLAVAQQLLAASAAARPERDPAQFCQHGYAYAIGSPCCVEPEPTEPAKVERCDHPDEKCDVVYATACECGAVMCPVSAQWLGEE